MKYFILVIALVLQQAALAQSAPAATAHHYVVQDGGQYGYEAVPSPAERWSGSKAGEVVLLGYNGTQDGTMQLMRLVYPATVYVMQCSAPCEFYTMMLFEGGKFITTSMARTAPGSLAQLAFDDAAAGRLQRYVDRRNKAALLHVWCSQATGCNGRAAPK